MVTAADSCCVRDHKLAADTQLHSPFTRRIRYFVLRGPESPLLSISVDADADNTQDHGIAHLADLHLE
jgi:hypothetical protein